MDMNFSSNFSFLHERLVCGNLSRESVSDAFRLPEVFQPYHITFAVTFMLFMLVGLPWNLLVMGIIVKQRLYQQPTIILLLNLVVTDFLTLLTLAVTTSTGIAGEFALGRSDQVKCEICRLELLASKVLGASSNLTVAMIAFDRFFFLYKPLHYDKRIRVKGTLVVVAVMWLLSFLFSLLHFVLLRNIRMGRLLLWCQWDLSKHPYFHVVSLLVIIVPYIFLLACNIWVVAIVLRNIRKIYKVQKSSKKHVVRRASMVVLNQRMKETRNRKELHLMRVFGGIIAANTLASLPTVAVVVTFSFSSTLLPKEFIVASIILFYSQFVVHPILESTLIKEIRIPMLKTLSCACCCEANFSRSGNTDDAYKHNAMCCCFHHCHNNNEPPCCCAFKLINNAPAVHNIANHAPLSQEGGGTSDTNVEDVAQDYASPSVGHASNENAADLPLEEANTESKGTSKI